MTEEWKGRDETRTHSASWSDMSTLPQVGWGRSMQPDQGSVQVHWYCQARRVRSVEMCGAV